MDVERVLARLRGFVEQSKLGPRPPDPRGVVNFGDTRRPVGDLTALIGQAHSIEKILDRVTPGWRALEKADDTGRWQQHRRAAIRAIAELEEAAELREILGDDAPTINANRLHPWAWEGARSMWASQHYRQGVVDALKRINAEAQNKTNRHELSETPLFRQLFSLEDPKPGMPRLRLFDDDGGDTFKSVHRGAMALAEGLFAGIRNVVAHTVVETEADEQAALEQLAAVSVLARWVDEAKVVTAP